MHMIKISHDLFTHKDNWRDAILIAYENSEFRPPDVDDKSYWQHELDAFDRVFKQLEELRLSGEIILD